MQPFCAAVDWGTTNLRVWLLAASGDVLATHRSAEGLASVADRQFAAILGRRLGDLGAASDLPVMICGMAGSRTGWVEVPYLEAPARLGDIAAAAVRVADSGRDIRILPGICQRRGGLPDVMRGEETQLLGAHVGGIADGMFCMPGTHSKWAVVRQGSLERFSTYMTGELFELLSKHSVLAQFAGEARRPVEEEAEFGQAVRAVLDDPRQALGRMFSIRAAALLDGEGDAAAARLSGLLIGAEIAATGANMGSVAKGAPILLVASGGLAGAYASAMAVAGLAPSLLDPETLAVRGMFEAAQFHWMAKRKPAIVV